MLFQGEMHVKMTQISFLGLMNTARCLPNLLYFMRWKYLFSFIKTIMAYVAFKEFDKKIGKKSLFNYSLEMKGLRRATFYQKLLKVNTTSGRVLISYCLNKGFIGSLYFSDYCQTQLLSTL